MAHVESVDCIYFFLQKFFLDTLLLLEYTLQLLLLITSDLDWHIATTFVLGRHHSGLMRDVAHVKVNIELLLLSDESIALRLRLVVLRSLP